MLFIAVILVLNALVPTKAWRFMDVPIGECVTLVIYAISMVHVLVRPFVRHRLTTITMVCLAVVSVAALHGYLQVDEKEYWFWNAKQAIHYLFIFPLIAYIRTKKDFDRLLSLYLFIGLASAVLLWVYHIRPELVTSASGTGLLMASVTGSVRVFTPGMQYAFLAAVGLLPYLYRRRWLLPAAVLLLSGLAWTYARSYWIIVAVCALVSMFLTFRLRQLQRTLFFVGSLLTLVVLSFLLLGEQGSSAVGRIVTLKGLQFTSAMQFDSLGWRFVDAANAIRVPQTVTEKAIGVFAKPYRTDDWLGVAPHLAYTGLFYHYGAIGVAAFGWLVVALTRGLLRVRTGSLPGPDRRAANSLLCAWVGLLLYSMVGGTFMSGPHIMALMIVIHGVALLSRRASRQSFPFPVSPPLDRCAPIEWPGGRSPRPSPCSVPASGVCSSEARMGAQSR
jgi:hypothetical protein